LLAGLPFLSTSNEIRQWTQLESLGIPFKSTQDLVDSTEPLKKLKNLTLRGLFRGEYSFLGSFTNLTKLNLGYHSPTPAVLSLPNLVSLKLGYPSELPLGLTRLSILRCDWLDIEWQVESLIKITNLRKLSLDSQKISNFNQISLLTNLVDLKVGMHLRQLIPNILNFREKRPGEDYPEFQDWDVELLERWNS
jgi:hypothetical protein